MYTVEKTYCTCHPETCCCFDYELVLNGNFVAGSDDRAALEEIAAKMNGAAEETSDGSCPQCRFTHADDEPCQL